MSLSNASECLRQASPNVERESNLLIHLFMVYSLIPPVDLLFTDTYASIASI